MDIPAVSSSRYSDKAKPAGSVICERVLFDVASRAYAPKHDVFYEGDLNQHVFQIESGGLPLKDHRRRKAPDFKFCLSRRCHRSWCLG